MTLGGSCADQEGWAADQFGSLPRTGFDLHAGTYNLSEIDDVFDFDQSCSPSEAMLPDTARTLSADPEPESVRPF